MSDLKERLRAEAKRFGNCESYVKAMHDDAANEIERLERERDNLRRCVQWYAEGNHLLLDDTWESPESDCWLCPPTEFEGREPYDPKNPVDISKRPLHKIDFDPPWMVEDGSVARTVLAGGSMNTDPSDEETIVHAAPRVEPKMGKQ